MLLPLDIPFEYWIEHINFGLLYVMFRSALRYSTGEFQAFQVIVFVVFGAMD